MTGAALGKILRGIVASTMACGAVGCGPSYGGDVWDPRLHEPDYVPPPELARLPRGDWLRDPSTCGRACKGYADECRMVPNEQGPGEYLQCHIQYGEPQPVLGKELPAERCKILCGGGGAASCAVLETRIGGRPVIQCEAMPCVAGRRPAGLARGGAVTSVGEHFAEVARLEAASVVAFRILARELRAAGAPERLSLGAERAARDEVRHARITGTLARRNGARPARLSVAPARRRSLEAIARENAVEGCVLETWGALLAAWQAEASRDPEVRAAMRRIARDEARHAALGWTVAAWAEARLDPAARRRVERARAAAIRRLCETRWGEPNEELAQVAGLPRVCELERLHQGIGALLAESVGKPETRRARYMHCASASPVTDATSDLARRVG